MKLEPTAQALAEWRDCPKCGGRPIRLYQYAQFAGRGQAYCQPCQNTYGPGPRPKRKPYVPSARVRMQDMPLVDLVAHLVKRHDQVGYTGRYGGKYISLFSLAVRADANGLCEMPTGRGRVCGEPATEMDHIRPMSEGGAWFDLANVRSSCRRCNVRKGGHWCGECFWCEPRDTRRYEEGLW